MDGSVIVAGQQSPARRVATTSAAGVSAATIKRTDVGRPSIDLPRPIPPHEATSTTAVQRAAIVRKYATGRPSGWGPPMYTSTSTERAIPSATTVTRRASPADRVGTGSAVAAASTRARSSAEGP